MNELKVVYVNLWGEEEVIRGSMYFSEEDAVQAGSYEDGSPLPGYIRTVKLVEVWDGEA